MLNTARALGLPALAAAAFLLFSAGAGATTGQIPLCPQPDVPLTAAQKSSLVKTATQCTTAFNSSNAATDCTLGTVSGSVAPYAECAQCTVSITCTVVENSKTKEFGINGYRASTDTLEDLTTQGLRSSPAQE
ncbi:MAG: hypothetical protein OXC10_19000 [Rhodospirillaceae bacterium]|nr:hypothetical protein [Rhodospirillaceae bacterium]